MTVLAIGMLVLAVNLWAWMAYVDAMRWAVLVVEGEGLGMHPTVRQTRKLLGTIERYPVTSAVTGGCFGTVLLLSLLIGPKMPRGGR